MFFEKHFKINSLCFSFNHISSSSAAEHSSCNSADLTRAGQIMKGYLCSLCEHLRCVAYLWLSPVARHLNLLDSYRNTMTNKDLVYA